MADTLTYTGPLTWNIDPTHSSVDFSVKHLGIFTVRGSLGTVTGTVQTTDTALSGLSITIDTNGITTNNEQRDAHLKAADFLNVAQYPTITFESTSVTPNSDGEYNVVGNLTILGKTNPVTIEAEIVPPVKDPWGNTRAGATGSGVIKRTEWGMSYNSVLETGHLMVGEDIKFTFDVQAVAALPSA
jgi:polyisoprenoid-binding protein YceI